MRYVVHDAVIENNISLDDAVHAWVYLSENNGPLPFPIDDSLESQYNSHDTLMQDSFIEYLNSTDECKFILNTERGGLERDYFEAGWLMAEIHHNISKQLGYKKNASSFSIKEYSASEGNYF